jgi:hypothetical protein
MEQYHKVIVARDIEIPLNLEDRMHCFNATAVYPEKARRYKPALKMVLKVRMEVTLHSPPC